MAITRFYYDVQVFRGTPSTNATGTTIVGTKTLASTIQGVVNQSQTNERDANGQWGMAMNYKLFCATNSDVLKDDNIKVVGSSDPAINGTYRVIGEPKNTVKRNHHLRIMLEKLEVDNNG